MLWELKTKLYSLTWFCNLVLKYYRAFFKRFLNFCMPARVHVYHVLAGACGSWGTLDSQNWTYRCLWVIWRGCWESKPGASAKAANALNSRVSAEDWLSLSVSQDRVFLGPHSVGKALGFRKYFFLSLYPGQKLLWLEDWNVIPIDL